MAWEPQKNYAERREARATRLRDRADKAEAASEAAHAGVKAIADRIPLGQPILVGHHSEGRARRDQDKIHRGMQKTVELSRKAEHLHSRANAAERNAAISSDDPEAIEKLEAKLLLVRAERARWRLIAAAMRKKAPEKRVEELRKLEPFSSEELKTLRFSGDVSYMTKNLGAEERRIQARMTELRERAQAPAPESVELNGIAITEEDNRVRMTFPGKPEQRVRIDLKSSGFRFARSLGVWQRHASTQAWHHAKRIAGEGPPWTTK